MDFGKVVSALSAMGYKRAAARAKIVHDVVLSAIRTSGVKGFVTNDFRIVSIEMVDGEPKVGWEPKVNRWTGAELKAVLKGAATLEGPWEDVRRQDGGGPS